MHFGLQELEISKEIELIEKIKLSELAGRFLPCDRKYEFHDF
jgi:hypothetical protein